MYKTMDTEQTENKSDSAEKNCEETKFLACGTKKQSIGPKFGRRHEQMLIFFGLTFLSFCVKVSINMAIVAMTDLSANATSGIPIYNWNNKNVIISAFFWGYVVPQIGAGWLATHYGPKWFLVGAMAISSLVGCLIPTIAAEFGSLGVILCRVIQGFCQGFVFPSVHMLLARWVPPGERSMISTIVYAGGPCGTTVSLLITGYLSASTSGWPMSFYFFNGLGLIWTVYFSFFGYNTPADHSSITKEERGYIEESLGRVQNKRELSTPWIPILTSPPFWALVLTQCGFQWGFYTMLSEIPLYMNKVMKFNLTSNSILSSLPYLSHWIFGILFGYISDMLLRKKVFKIETIRKIMNSIGFIVPAIALIFLGNCGPESSSKALVLLVIAVGINALSMSGFFINHMELSPNHAGVVMGICMELGSVCALMAPLLVQVLVTEEHNTEQWKLIFYSSSAIYFVTNFSFVFFGSSKIQPWNDENISKDAESM